MVEVFKTNVQKPDQASMLLHLIHQNFSHYHANFDLEDCDKILRVAYDKGEIKSSYLMELLKDVGFSAEILPDESPSNDSKDIPSKNGREFISFVQMIRGCQSNEHLDSFGKSQKGH
jgi:hypothetical protein